MRIDTVIPLRWWWSCSRVDRWIDDNNPQDPESVEGHLWASRRHREAAQYFAGQADRAGIWAIICAAIFVAVLIAGIVQAVVAS